MLVAAHDLEQVWGAVAGYRSSRCEHSAVASFLEPRTLPRGLPSALRIDQVQVVGGLPAFFAVRFFAIPGAYLFTYGARMAALG